VNDADAAAAAASQRLERSRSEKAANYRQATNTLRRKGFAVLSVKNFPGGVDSRRNVGYV